MEVAQSVLLHFATDTVLQHNAQTHTFENTESKSSTRIDSSPPHTHYTAHNLLPQFFSSLEPPKIPSVGKGLGLMTKLMKK